MISKLFNTRFKRWILLYTPIIVLLFIIFCNYHVASAANGKLFTDANAVPAKKVALVFGTSPKAKKGINLFYKYRMDAVASLWKVGKIQHVIVSGDNSRMTYDESTAMKESLIALGIPDSAITLDYAGFSTLDSVLRCKLVFGQTDIILVSQEFQNERAIFIAEHSGMHAVGFNAENVAASYSYKTVLREYFARVKAVFDIYLLGTQPKFPGPPEPIL